MSWDYDWRAGPRGGVLSTLDTYCTLVRLDRGAETIGGKRGRNVDSAYRHGQLPVAHKYNNPLVVPLEVRYRDTDGAGAVTHVDGRAGHTYENKATVEGLLAGAKDLATLQRTTPEHGTLQIDVEPLTPSQITQDRFTYRYNLLAPEAFWRSTTLQSETASPLTVGGNAPAYDPVVEIVGGTDVVVTFTTHGEAITVEGATPAGGISVDFGAIDTLPVTRISDGSDYHRFVSFSRPYGVILEYGSYPFTVAGSPSSVTVKWRDRVR